MEDWATRNKGKCFITDLGSDQTKEVDGRPVTMGRYAVWSPIADADNHRIIEVGTDCGQLQKKYNINTAMIYHLQKKEV